MKKLLYSSVFTIVSVGSAFAQAPAIGTKSAPGPFQTRPVEVTDTAVAPAVESRSGVEAGTVRVNAQAIEDGARLDGDTTALLRILPSVQFDSQRYRGRREDLQDIRPEEFTISGGRIYDNLITIDGLDVGTRLDTSNTNAANFNETVGATSQSQWLDTSLLDSLIVREANVSAEFGSFSGGVVDARTRQPVGALAASASVRCTNTDQTSFIVNAPTRLSLSGQEIVSPPDYQRCGFSASLDLPETQGFSTMLAFNESFSSVRYFRTAAYGGGSYDQESRSRNYLFKATRDLGTFAKLDLQVVHSPYESEFANANARNNQIVSFGGGNRAQIKLLAGQAQLLGAKDWDLALSWVDSDSSRRAPANNFSWPTAAPTFSTCTTSTNCSEGGFGDINQTEQTLGLTGTIGWELPIGEIRSGFMLNRVQANKTRPQTNRAYSTGTSASTGRGFVGAATVCLDSTDIACRNGEVALGQYQEYRAYDIDAEVETAAIWTEVFVPVSDFEFRLGLRADNDSFTGNTDVAPRFSVSWDGGGPLSVTLGANRYYAKSFLGYAIREQEPNSFTYGRVASVVSGQQRFANLWPLVRESRSVSYRDANLATPFSDELMMQVDVRLPWTTTAMLQWTSREFKDEITMAPGLSTIVPASNGGTLTTTVRVPSNDGSSSYEALRFEARRAFGRNHHVSLTGEVSERRQFGEDRFITYDDDLASRPAYVFGEEILSLADLLQRNELANFATPAVVNASWTGRWLAQRLTSTLSARWSEGYERIEETGATRTINGTRYSVVDVVQFKSAWVADLKLTARLIREGRIAVDLNLDVTNLFDEVQSSVARTAAQPYERGRVIWTGLTFRY